MNVADIYGKKYVDDVSYCKLAMRKLSGWYRCVQFSVVLGAVCLLFGCQTSDKQQMEYEKLLAGFRKEQSYVDLQQRANAELKGWIAQGLEPVKFLQECAWKIDEGVFFNSDRTKGYLLLLIQDQVQGAESDYVYVMYANKLNDKWEVFFEGLPNLVFPRKRFGDRQLSLAELSEQGRAALLPTYLRNGQPNNAYVAKPDLAELRKRHLKFLKHF